MPIDPISQYRSQDNSLQQILNGGTNAITGILNQAIQLGRDRVNNQERRDDSLITQDNFQTGLAQRRADNLITQQNNQRNFDYTADQNDRKFALLNEQNNFTQNRQTAQDLFNNNNTTTKLGMAQTMQDANIANIDADNTRADKSVNAAQERADTQAKNASITTKARQDALDLKNKLLQDALNVKLGNAGTPKPPTTFQAQEIQNAQNAENRRNKTEAQKAMEMTVKGNSEAFPPQMSQFTNGYEQTIQKDYANYQKNNPDSNLAYDKYKDSPPKPLSFPSYADYEAKIPPQQIAAAQAYDKNPYASELQSARNQPNADAYANLLPNVSPTVLQQRRDFWNHATGGAVVNPNEDPLSKLLNKYK